jgi:hypothetical protein
LLTPIVIYTRWPTRTPLVVDAASPSLCPCEHGPVGVNCNSTLYQVAPFVITTREVKLMVTRSSGHPHDAPPGPQSGITFPCFTLIGVATCGVAANAAPMPNVSVRAKQAIHLRARTTRRV